MPMGIAEALTPEAKLESTLATEVIDREVIDREGTIDDDIPHLERAGSPGPAASSKSVVIAIPKGSTVATLLRSRAGLSLSTTLETEVASPTQAMHLEEVRRMRFFTIFAALMATTACAVIPLLDGAPLARNIHWLATISTAMIGFVTAIVIRDGTRYRSWMGTVLGLSAATAISSGFYFWGVYSAVLLMVPIGTYFFALGASFWGAVAIHTLGATAHAALAILQIAGVVAPVGLIQPLRFEALQQAGMLAALQIVFLGAFVMARAVRKSSMDTLERLDGAVRYIAQREALLEEAKEELARARKVGDAGRFTGQVLGSFRLGNILGRGGMGDVYEAVHTESDELAAVKLLNRDAISNPGLVARFYRELEIARSIQAEHIVRVLEFPEPDAAIPYLAMERLHGETLGDVLRAESQMSPRNTLALLQAMTDGIGAAHKLGIVHRDLKPANLLAHQQDGRTVWKILDFGVSKLQDQSGELTQGKMVGTPTYMSPEQAAGEDVDARADLYSIGVILYRVLTGRLAFRGSSIPAILKAVHGDMPAQPSRIAALSTDIDCVLALAMAKHPDDRFASAQELRLAFEQALLGTLTPTTRTRAEKLIARYPWGQRNLR